MLARVTGTAHGVGGARAYHEATVHTPESVRRSPPLDWENRPHAYKDYLELAAEALPPELERLLRLGAGVVRTRTYAGGVTYGFRTYSSAGALYPVEVYAATGDGLFHFHPGELAVRRLRSEDVRGALAPACTVLALTGILWRTAWKYGARGYRHLWWDAGTMLANLLALSDGARVLTAFVDEEIDRVVGADGEREVGLCLLALGEDEVPPAPHLARLEHEARPLSHVERDYPVAWEAHGSARLASPAEVERQRDRYPEPATESWPDGLDRVLRRRGSTREFSSQPVDRGQLAAVLARALGPIPADLDACNETFAIVHNVEGLEPGAYHFEPPDRFELVRAGDFRLEAAHLVLDQPLGALAAATVFFTADLDAVIGRHGNRGYRWALLEAGIRTGRVYLGAVADGLGATASTFFDVEVSRFFATSQSPMLCVAIGNGERR